jgi:hypothetical protein
MSSIEERPDRATIREFCEAEHMLLELDHLSARPGANSQQKGGAEGAAPRRARYAGRQDRCRPSAVTSIGRRAQRAILIANEWRSSVAGNIENGRPLIEAEALGHGESGPMMKRDLPFTAHTAQRLTTIADVMPADAHCVPIMVGDDPEERHHTADLAKRIAVQGIEGRPLGAAA